MAQTGNSSYSSYVPQSSNQITTELNPAELNKCLDQIQRKREYNRKYYQNKVKPQKQQEKKELQRLRERCVELEQNHNGEQLRHLMYQNQDLSEKVAQLTQENIALKEALEASRQRNYELLMSNSEQYLPKIEGLSLKR